jgi:hypothetical protein
VDVGGTLYHQIAREQKKPCKLRLQSIGGGMGVVWGGRRRRFGDLAVWWTCGGVGGAWCCGVAKSHKNEHTLETDVYRA